MSGCNVGLHHRCDGGCGCLCHAQAPAPGTDASGPALSRANEKASQAVADYWKSIGFKP